MSDNENNTSALEDLVKIVQQMHEAMKLVASNQEKLLAEQERMGKALGEAGLCIGKLDETLRAHAAGLVNHAEVLESNSKLLCGCGKRWGYRLRTLQRRLPDP